MCEVLKQNMLRIVESESENRPINGMLEPYSILKKNVDCDALPEKTVKNVLSQVKRDLDHPDHENQLKALEILNLFAARIDDTEIFIKLLEISRDKTRNPSVNALAKKCIVSLLKHLIKNENSNLNKLIWDCDRELQQQVASLLMENLDEATDEDTGKFLHTAIIPRVFSSSHDGRPLALDLGFQLIKCKPSCLCYIKKTDWFPMFISDIEREFIREVQQARESQDDDWYRMVIFLLKLGGEVFHQRVDITNALLKVVELGFKSSLIKEKMFSYECWKELIDTYSLNFDHMSSPKHLKLLLTPLSHNLSTHEMVTRKRFEIWVYLIQKLRDRGLLCLESFLNFCFGPFQEDSFLTKDNSNSNLCKRISSLKKETTAFLLEILGHYGHNNNNNNCIKIEKFTLERPLVNCSNFYSVDNCVVCSIGECCIRLLDWANKEEILKVIKCIWGSLLNITEGLDSEYQDTVFHKISNLLLSLAKIAETSHNCYDLILLPIVDVITSFKIFDSGLLLRNVLSPSVRFLLNSKKIDPNRLKKLLNTILFLGTGLKDEMFFKETCDLLIQIENNSEIAYLLWMTINNFAQELCDKNPLNELRCGYLLTYMLWLVQNYSIVPQDSKDVVLKIWKRIFDDISAKQVTFYTMMLHAVQKIMKKNPLVINNIPIFLQLLLIDSFGEHFDLVFVGDLLQLLLDLLNCPIVSKENIKKLSQVFIICLNSILHQKDKKFELIYEKMFKVIQHFLQPHQTYSILEKLETILREIHHLKMAVPQTLKTLIMDLTIHKDSEISQQALRILCLLEENSGEPLHKTSDGFMQNSNSLLSRAAKIASMAQTSPKLPYIPSTEVVRLLGQDVNTGDMFKLKGSQLKNTPKTFKSPKPPAVMPRLKKIMANCKDNRNDNEYVPINNEYKFDKKKLTEHQREVLKRRREDIPALYQDLSQSQGNSQSNSQDETMCIMETSSSQIVQNNRKENHAPEDSNAKMDSNCTTPKSKSSAGNNSNDSSMELTEVEEGEKDQTRETDSKKTLIDDFVHKAKEFLALNNVWKETNTTNNNMVKFTTNQENTKTCFFEKLPELKRKAEAVSFGEALNKDKIQNKETGCRSVPKNTVNTDEEKMKDIKSANKKQEFKRKAEAVPFDQALNKEKIQNKENGCHPVPKNTELGARSNPVDTDETVKKDIMTKNKKQNVEQINQIENNINSKTPNKEQINQFVDDTIWSTPNKKQKMEEINQVEDNMNCKTRNRKQNLKQINQIEDDTICETPNRKQNVEQINQTEDDLNCKAPNPEERKRSRKRKAPVKRLETNSKKLQENKKIPEAKVTSSSLSASTKQKKKKNNVCRLNSELKKLHMDIVGGEEFRQNIDLLGERKSRRRSDKNNKSNNDSKQLESVIQVNKENSTKTINGVMETSPEKSDLPEKRKRKSVFLTKLSEFCVLNKHDRRGLKATVTQPQVYLTPLTREYMNESSKTETIKETLLEFVPSGGKLRKRSKSLSEETDRSSNNVKPFKRKRSFSYSGGEESIAYDAKTIINNLSQDNLVSGQSKTTMSSQNTEDVIESSQESFVDLQTISSTTKSDLESLVKQLHSSQTLQQTESSNSLDLTQNQIKSVLIQKTAETLNQNIQEHTEEIGEEKKDETTAQGTKEFSYLRNNVCDFETNSNKDTFVNESLSETFSPDALLQKDLEQCSRRQLTAKEKEICEAETETMLSDSSFNLDYIQTSPVTSDTPSKNSRLLTDTINISPIQQLEKRRKEKSMHLQVSLDEKCSKTSEDSEQILSSSSKEIYGKTPDLFDSEPIDNKCEEVSSQPSEIQKGKQANGEITQQFNTRSTKLLGLVSNGVQRKMNITSIDKLSTVNSNIVASPKTDRIRKIMQNCEEQKNIAVVNLLDSDDECRDSLHTEEVLEFVRPLPDPMATPKSSILKRKRKMTDSPADDGVQASKRKRVNFSDPPITCKKVFVQDKDEVKLKLDALKSSKAFLRKVAEDCINANTPYIIIDEDINPNENVTSRKVHTITKDDLVVKDKIDHSENNTEDYRFSCDMDTQGSVDTTNPFLLDDSEPICPGLINCTESVQVVLTDLTSPVFVTSLLEELKQKSILTVGDLAKLTERQVNRLPLKMPKIRRVKEALSFFFKIKQEYEEKETDNVFIRNFQEHMNCAQQLSKTTQSVVNERNCSPERVTVAQTSFSRAEETPTSSKKRPTLTRYTLQMSEEDNDFRFEEEKTEVVEIKPESVEPNIEDILDSLNQSRLQELCIGATDRLIRLHQNEPVLELLMAKYYDKMPLDEVWNKFSKYFYKRLREENQPVPQNKS